MNLATHLKQPLWDAVRTNYEHKNYSGAILDGIHFLGTLIRLKSGVDADGAQLIGQAMGGDNPPIRLNKLQTETDRNIQRGVEHIIRGLYQAIRNPRSHERLADSETDAITLLLFIEYLSNLIDKSKGIYSEDDALTRIFDPNFVEQERYADLMVENIPSKYRLDVLLAAFRRKEEGDGAKLRYAFGSLIRGLNEYERKTFVDAVSEELLTANEETTFRLIIQTLPPTLWPSYGEAARLRAENKLIASVRSGQYDGTKDKCIDGALGTWVSSIAPHLLLKQDLVLAIGALLRSDYHNHVAYACKYVLHLLPNLDPDVSYSTRTAIKVALSRGNKSVRDFLNAIDDLIGKKAWVKPFEKELKEFKEKKSKFDDLDDEVPF
jgi:uncharacterized protein (TIGR02391 family)